MSKSKAKFTYLANGTLDITTWLDKIKHEHQINDVSLLSKACVFTQQMTQGLNTFYGQPYLEFGLDVVEVILDLKLLNPETAAASLIGTTIPLSEEIEKQIKKEFGSDVLKLILGLQQMDIIPSLQTHYNHKNQVEKIRRMLLAMATDMLVVIIKLAERLCFMRNIKNIPESTRKLYATEILEIYAPLANRLGIGQLKWELEDLTFRYLEPIQYKMIAAFLAERRIDRERRIQQIMHDLQNKLKGVNFQFKITGRPKHIYSIYLKSTRKEVSYKDIYDSNAIRVLVPTIQDCYTMLSIVHSHWQPIMEEFDDYIAHPKKNGYRSMHTTLIGDNAKHFEIQIRTFDMHEEAERGIAAHWLYKENKISYLYQLLDWHQEIEKSKSFTALGNEIYVITPVGEILNLPQGATPIDFAYHIHSELGHRCRGAKVNGQIVPLTYTLRTGDKVEIMPILQGNPSRDWLNTELGYVKTRCAKNKILHWFRQQERSSIRPPQIMQAIKPQKPTGTPNSTPTISAQNNHNKNDGAAIVDAHDLLTRLSKCCKPIPGDYIVGYITKGRGISIHKKNCMNIHSLSHSERFISVNWDAKNNDFFSADLKIIGEHHKSILQDITGLFANEKLTLLQLQSTLNKNQNKIFITATIQIKDKEDLQRLRHRIEQLPSVISTSREN